jgi:hypothetical protein
VSENNLLRDFAEAFFVAGTLTAIVFCLQWNYGYDLGDEGWQWYLSQRVHLGEMPIRDFFSYDPGRYVWSAAWFKMLRSDGLFEQRFANTCFGLLGLTSAYIALRAAGMRRSVRLVTAVILALAMGYPLHKTYEQSLSLIGISALAYALYSPDDSKNWWLPGLVTGFAAIIGRNSGLYIAVGSLLGVVTVLKLADMRTARRALFVYCTWVLIGYSPIILWFALDGRFRTAMIESILFTPYWQIPVAVPFPWRVTQSISGSYNIQITAISWLCVTVSAIYIIYGARLIHSLVVSKWAIAFRQYALGASALFLGLPFLHHAFYRGDFAHIAQGILPVFILAAAQVELTKNLIDASVTAVLITLALLSWVPSEPRGGAILRSRNGAVMAPYVVDGRTFYLDQREAAVLREVRRLQTVCKAGDGQVVAMPYYPGLLAYLHRRSPYWEMYYLYRRSEPFQRQEIVQLQSYGTKVAIVNPNAAMDGKATLRIEATNPVLYTYIRSNFQKVKTSPDNLAGFVFLSRNCGADSVK